MPQQNGFVERRNRTVFDMARSLLKSKNLPGTFWGEAISTAVYLLNRDPTKAVIGKTPYESIYGCKPNVSHLRTFGCVAHVKTAEPHLSKLIGRSTMMVFSDTRGVLAPRHTASTMLEPSVYEFHVTSCLKKTKRGIGAQQPTMLQTVTYSQLNFPLMMMQGRTSRWLARHPTLQKKTHA